MNSRLLPITRICCPYRIRDGTVHKAPLSNKIFPYKKAVIPYLAELSDQARRTGSVNTIVRRRDGTLYGDNTDYDGFLYLLAEAGIDPAGKKALIQALLQAQSRKS